MSENSNFLVSEITKMYGPVKRARGCHLYTAKGVRLTDLWQAGGRAILGWGAGSAVTVFKNVLERKITFEFDTDFSPKVGEEKSRLSKAVSELLGDSRRIFAFNSCLGEKSPAEFVRKNFGLTPKTYRPWTKTDWTGEQAVVVEPPFAWDGSFFLLAIKEGFEVGGVGKSVEIGQYRIPAPLSAAFTRAIHDLIAEIPKREEKHWFLFDTVLARYWLREGPYLFPKIPEEEYLSFTKYCLEKKLVISPDFGAPSIVPFGADRGNFTLMKNSPFGE